MNIIISPGDNNAVKEAVDLFSLSRVFAGSWREPIKIINLSEDEASLATEYFEEQGKKVKIE